MTHGYRRTASLTKSGIQVAGVGRGKIRRKEVGNIKWTDFSVAGIHRRCSPL